VRPILFTIPHPTLLACVLLFVAALVGIGAWLFWLKRRNALTADYLWTGVIGLVVVVVLLIILSFMQQVHINAYGTMLMLGFLLGTLVGIRLGQRRGVSAERIIDLGLVILIGALIGARGLYLLLTPNAGPFLDLHALLNQGLGGLSFHGGLLGGLLTGGTYIVWNKLRFWRVTDSLAPAIALGYAITRVGCFLNGCCFGKAAANLPWAMCFPQSPELFPHDHLVHPTQLYASLMGFAMFGILLLLSRGNSMGREGRLFMVFLALEGIERFVMEIFRYTAVDQGVLTLAQGASVLITLVGIAGWLLLPKYPAVDTLLVTETPAGK